LSQRRTATKKATGPQRLGLFFGSRRDREAAPVRTPSTAGMRRTRFHVMVAVGLVCMVGLVGRSFWVQVAHGAGYRAEGVQQRQRFTAITASRGTIFDRDGNEMAITVPATSIYANPQAIIDPAATAHVLAQLLGIDAVSETDLATKLSDESSTFVYVQRFVDENVAEAVLSLNLAGIFGITEPERVEVAGGLARNIVGRTDPFGSGATGIELQYDKVLRGEDGQMVKESSNGRSLPGTERVVDQPRPGTDLVLTIDRSMQYQVEQILLARVNELTAKGGNAIVMDTATGEILAIASVRKNAEGIPELTSGNLAAVEAHEPGSVAKVFSIAATLDSGVATTDRVYDVPGVYVFDEGQEYEKTIKDAYPHDLESMSLRDIFVHSSNIGTLMAAGEVGSPRLHDYLDSFGFGKISSLQFPGETPGMLKQAENWRGSENATITYGYGFSASSLQLISAVNAIANDGVYVSPRLVKATIDEKGSLWEAPSGESHRVVSEPTATTMQALMAAVVCEGTGTRARIEGISVAGKTGTGYKIQENGTYENEDGTRAYFATFVGFLPANDPRITILVSIDEPDPSSRDRFGGTAAAPAFAKIATLSIHERAIEPVAGDAGCPAVPE
jgi:cell division protein FtsI (penicillin-binding protein 3)